MKVLVTGATGFVGRGVCAWVQSNGHEVVASTRKVGADLPASIRQYNIAGLGTATDWSEALRDVQVVVHCAARAHVMNETAPDPLALFREVNRDGTLSLARQAAKAGVRRFIFISSIKVNGESTQPNRPFTADDTPAPMDPYGISKFEAEQGLKEIAQQTGMQVVIIRPPLIYGPGVKANFESLISSIKRGIPLPIGALDHNRRSFVALGNLTELIGLCLTHKSATNQTFLVSDGEDLSTASLARRIGLAVGRPARLIHVPASWIRIGAAMFRRPGIYQRLCGSLQVDIHKTRELLDWSPTVSVDAALQEASRDDNTKRSPNRL